MGNGRVAPKFHWAFDIAECMVADGFVVDAFTLERLHLRVKAIANHCKNLNKYEAAVMAGVTSSHMNNLVNTDSWSSGCNLVGKVASVPWSPNIIVADKARYFGEVFTVGSFVFRGCIGRVLWVGLAEPVL
jgi:hypothetical protein